MAHSLTVWASSLSRILRVSRLVLEHHFEGLILCSLAHLDPGTYSGRWHHLDIHQRRLAIHASFRRTWDFYPAVGQSHSGGLGWSIFKCVPFGLDVFTGPKTTIPATLHATYYASGPTAPPAKRADLLLPLSTFANDTGNDASVPPSFSVSISSSPITFDQYLIHNGISS